MDKNIQDRAESQRESHLLAITPLANAKIERSLKNILQAHTLTRALIRAHPHTHTPACNPGCSLYTNTHGMLVNGGLSELGQQCATVLDRRCLLTQA